MPHKKGLKVIKEGNETITRAMNWFKRTGVHNLKSYVYKRK